MLRKAWDTGETVFYAGLCFLIIIILIIPLFLCRVIQDRGKPNSVFNMKKETKVLWILLALVIAGTILRIYHLDFQCAWTDEEFTLGVAARGWADLVSYTLTNDCNPPLYYMLVKLSGLVLGTGIVAARIVSVIAGVLLIPVAYLIGKEYSDDILGLLIAGFVTSAYPLIYYSQFARSYATMTLLFAVFLYFFLRLANGKSTRGGFTVFGLLAIYTHLFTIVPITLLTLWVWAKYKERFNRTVTIMAVACLPLLYLLYLVIFVRVNATSSFSGLDWFGLLWFMPMEFFGYAYAVIATLIVYSLLKTEGIRLQLLFLIALFSVFSLIVASFIVPVFPRYILMIIPIFLLIAFEPLSSRLQEKFPNPDQVLAIVIGIIFVFLCIQYLLLIQYYFVPLPYCVPVIHGVPLPPLQ